MEACKSVTDRSGRRAAVSRTSLLLLFWCLVGAVCVTLGLTIVVRVRTAATRRRVARYQRVVRDHLTAFVVGARDDLPPPPHGRFEQRILRGDLVALLPSVKGE